MKLYLKNIRYFVCSLAVLLVVTSCKKGLDYKNNGAINPENVWSDPTMIKAFLNDIYGASMPGWSFDGNSTDEGYNGAKTLGNYQRGIIAVDQTTSALNYSVIDKANFFLDQLDAVAVLSADIKAQYTAEAKFWRAWSYWNMVNNLGGVPLILHTQNADDVNALFKTRNKTSECITQIIKDLDDAIAVLPGKYASNADYGRITKVAAMAVKGKVLMTYASPLFNPTNDASRWQAAYDANKAAKDYALTQGHDLFPNYKNIWYTERNQEVIMVRQYTFPGAGIAFNSIRPTPLTKDATGVNQPTLNLLLAYPKRDGSPMQFDKNQMSDPAYNTQFMTDFYTNRDSRFYATIFFGGTPYPTPDEVSPVYVKGNSFWEVWKYDAATDKYSSAMNVVHTGMTGGGQTGFWERKGLDTTLVAALYAQGQTDWPVIRYAEVLMNYGECANELGKSGEALQVLKDIRRRAGITAGAGSNYGITASATSDIRDAYMNERQVEFAFENKRFGDLRRWKRYDLLNAQTFKHGLYATLKDGVVISPSETIMNATTRAKLRGVYIDNLDGDPNFKFNLDLNHWFYAIPPAQISQSKNVILQNKEWGGTFDPLQ
ncbi:RagB/SusD family nutrient uptake outer membrane protein [Pedobacter sp. HDW13]|uniref:RagB/SusD family nutrient uptake outer membrane protein n=1 Tax=Pedobacter sp. HDW13 TaxID=2714940 RepID=UPI00140CC5B6|nr:RagB/SusD family nutrient uptake outer membrane protein [Pedobacter sp. HDW13]QIL41340.1 RagB/SusD family nutrient uptake outer membrane protein [Pedobacter sp. HDW13]